MSTSHSYKAPWEAYNLYTTPNAYVFEPTEGGDDTPRQYMTIHRHDDDDTKAPSDAAPRITVDGKRPSGLSSPKSMQVWGLLGIIPLHTTWFVVVITGRNLVTKLLGSPIYMATDFKLLPVSPSVDKSLMVKHPVEKSLVELLKGHLYSAPFYFSHGWDLTSSLQRQADVLQQADTRQSATSAWRRADERFFWNQYLCKPLIEAASSQGGPDLDRFILPCIFGFLTLKDTKINGQDFLFGLIARRDRHRAGTRYFSRGIDEDGNVSNFNETEQFVILPNQRFSYVQTRGSVPVYWAEINNLRYKPDLVVMEREETGEATALHFRRQVETYGDNYLVNLVNQKGYEKAVKDAYERAVERLNNPRIHYTYYDFHHECKGMKFERVWNLVERLEGMGLKGDDWYEGGASDGIPVKRRQSSVVRTNCMDCLDRTNVVQSTLARWVLTYQLRTAKVLGPEEWVESHKEFMFLFRNVWADHADGVSKAYSGTGALKTDFTRTGKRSTSGALQDGANSITRYVKNNFFDGPRQDAYDLFTGAWTPAKGVRGTKRSLTIRAMPYVLLFSLAMILFGVVLPHHTPGPGVDGQTLQQSRHSSMPTWTYLTLWITLATFALRFILDQGVDFVAYPSLNRDKYDEVIRYDGKGWTSGKRGRGPTGQWGQNQKGGRYSGMGRGFIAEVGSTATGGGGQGGAGRRGAGYNGGSSEK
ncbi:unnamed protein product [Jaminaea pallidilutea]